MEFHSIPELTEKNLSVADMRSDREGPLRTTVSAGVRVDYRMVLGNFLPCLLSNAFESLGKSVDKSKQG